MTDTITWLHVGDLHLEDADGWQSLARLREIIAQANAWADDGIDFVYLPGDNANHGTREQYDAMIDALDALDLPWRIIPGDHDFEPRDLLNYEDAVPKANRPEQEVIAGHRCIFLDIVSAGSGGPDFRLTKHDRNRIGEELTRAEASGQTPLVFMHAYPGDLAADGEEIARAFADGGVAFVDTGHTHYNELLNDGRVIYGATRSTGQIEEGDGVAGFTMVCVHDRVPSWRFRRLDARGPHVQIVSPCDLRLMTRPADVRHVPRPGEIRVVAKVLGERHGATVTVRVGADGEPEEMWRIGNLWAATVRIDRPGLHRITVACGDVHDEIDVLVREESELPKRGLPVALGHACHAVGAWPAAGILGSQLGPNKNGGKA